MLRSLDGGIQGEGTIRVSSGSAVVLGLAKSRLEVAPTTAYLMVGDRCSRDCLFCAQARHSTAQADQLSRVTWPPYPVGEVILRLVAAYEQRAVHRCCLQVTSGRGVVQRVRDVVRQIASASAVPLCVCIRTGSMETIGDLLALGAERVTLALDAACPQAYNRVKGPGWQKALDLLRRAARRYPGRVGTHVIIGLGETEAEAVELLQAMQDAGIMTALFAFTPVPGTALGNEPPPALASYRRVQVARHLIVRGLGRYERFQFSPDGRLTSYGIEAPALAKLLLDGEAFQTSGCPGCNRPYYNERPAGPLYNYPRPLQLDEIAAATALVSDSLVDP